VGAFDIDWKRVVSQKGRTRGSAKEKFGLEKIGRGEGLRSGSGARGGIRRELVGKGGGENGSGRTRTVMCGGGEPGRQERFQVIEEDRACHWVMTEKGEGCVIWGSGGYRELVPKAPEGGGGGQKTCGQSSYTTSPYLSTGGGEGAKGDVKKKKKWKEDTVCRSPKKKLPKKRKSRKTTPCRQKSPRAQDHHKVVEGYVSRGQGGRGRESNPREWGA